MNWLDAVVLGIIEGVTEFLPISSTAHLMVTSELLGLAQSGFVKSFEIAIQLGAIAAVAALYWRTLLKPRELATVAVAFIPTGVVGLALYPFIKESLIGNVPLALVALAGGGAALIAFERLLPKRTEEDGPITYGQALLIGLAQALAVIPGVSRSAATIVGGLLLGVARQRIVEFSFLLAVPTMAAATGYDLLKNYRTFSADDLSVLAIGFAVSFVVAIIAIRWLLRFVRTHDFTSFGWYRIAAAALFALVLFH